MNLGPVLHALQRPLPRLTLAGGASRRLNSGAPAAGRPTPGLTDAATRAVLHLCSRMTRHVLPGTGRRQQPYPKSTIPGVELALAAL
jgi:hypothetical protein